MVTIKADGTYELLLCMNCCQAAAYAETSGVEDGDPEPLSHIAEGDHIIVLMDGDEVEAWGDQACDGCGTEGVTLYPAEGEQDGLKTFRAVEGE
jgi:hypothetical protein